ncbi:MAG: WYL domain-containing protein [Hellea sp.]
MKKTERLFHVIDSLRAARKPITAMQIASDLGVSQRTIYRDVKLLISQGLPIIGEAGMGYVIDADFNAPPLQFSADELDVISIGLRIAYRDGDAAMRRAADAAFAKIRAGLKNTERLDAIDLYAPGINTTPNAKFLSQARHAVRNKTTLEITYLSLANDISTRRVKPMALLFFKEATLLSGYCGLRHDFRHFRIDRIESLIDTGERFSGEHYKLRKAYFDQMKRERETQGAEGK